MPTRTNRQAPYRHADGSNCWTKNCSRGSEGGTYASFKSATEQVDDQNVWLHPYVVEGLENVDWGTHAQATKNLLTAATARFGDAMVGRTRAVFDLGDGRMMKVPFNDEGLLANWQEHRVYRETDPFIPVAPCEWDEVYGVRVLLMEKVTPTLESYKNLPDWAGSVDGAQVGYTTDGRLVAYDL